MSGRRSERTASGAPGGMWRQMVIGGVLMLLLAACGAAQGEGSSAGSGPAATPGAGASPGAGPWTYTDAVGDEITLEQPPERIVADTYSAASLWDFGIRPVGMFGWGLEAEESAWANTLGNVDVDQVEIVGRGPELNLEALAALRPDLIVGYGPSGLVEGDAVQKLQWVPEGTIDEITQIAPALATEWYRVSLEEAITGYQDLAAALGADVDTPEIQQAREDFDAANERLAEIAEGSDLRLAAVSAYEDALWVANPAGIAVLEHLADLGFEIVTPDEVAEGEAWQQLSWEQADRYPTDVLLYIGENPQETGELDGQAAWQDLPAVRAGQVVSFNDKWPYSWTFYADALDGLADQLEGFEAVAG